MLLKELFLSEDDQATAVFAFGRFNPPTIGHEKLLNTLRSVAQKMDAKPYLFLSHKQNAKTDPLSYQEKADYIQSTGKFADVEIGSADVNTIVQALQKLMGQGRTRVIMIAGSDRVTSFKQFLNQYNKQTDKKGNLVFDFDSVDVVSSGERDPDEEGVAGASASKARQAAINGDFATFSKIVLGGKNSKKNLPDLAEQNEHKGCSQQRTVV